jgi:hypothetical protein
MEQEAEASVNEGTLVNSDAADRFLDRAEQALESSHGGRRESETTLLQRLLRDLGSHVTARLSVPSSSGCRGAPVPAATPAATPVPQFTR